MEGEEQLEQWRRSVLAAPHSSFTTAHGIGRSWSSIVALFCSVPCMSVPQNGCLIESRACLLSTLHRITRASADKTN